MTARRPVRAASAAGARGRAPALAPAHLGDAAAAATVAVIVGGIALVITGIGMLAMALTIQSRWPGSPPPDAGSLMVLPLLAGALFLVLGAALAAGGVAVFAAASRARLVTGILAAVTAGLAAIGTVLAMTSMPPDPVVAVALTVGALVFGVAAILLLRPRR